MKTLQTICFVIFFLINHCKVNSLLLEDLHFHTVLLNKISLFILRIIICFIFVPEHSKKSEEYELQNTVNSEKLGVNDVLDLLQEKYAIISGGKSKEGCPIITFPDNNNFEMLSDSEYQRLMLYLSSVPS